MTTTPEAETVQTPEQLLTDLGELHMRALVSPLPKHPAAMGWQATTGSMAAGFARALHALNEVDSARAQEIVTWFQGPFEDEGPDPEEHTDWLERVVAKGDLRVMEQWVQDGRRLAEESKANTEAWEKKNQAGEVERDAIHKYFGLMYANYLVLPRTLLQSMPDVWQTPFVALLKTLDEAFAHVPQAEAYKVTAGKENLLRDMTVSELHTAGVEVSGDDELGHGPDTVYTSSETGEELDGDSYGFMPRKDPVPHYNRGRTRVEPRLGGGE
ncbi:hypothetical protein [Streptomyces sp. AS02]|uniref:hypothetical protein n=1 Tax=Streptomyces sp. AS02 TaxID=2938946 RepID=UPI002022787E|nr:hypothetical protein [Streptomyces sp. AS02]MCL8016910.1 hypothetical protein [Streptomyces sp. AS02]